LSGALVPPPAAPERGLGGRLHWRFWATTRSAATRTSSPVSTSSASAVAAGPVTTVPGGSPTKADASCPVESIDQSPCYSPHQLRVAYGIQPLLDSGIDGRGETVAVVAIAPSSSTPGGAGTDIRQDMEAFNKMFGCPPRGSRS
jgi:subtilase family serine protease